jgi:hypothetical protein
MGLFTDGAGRDYSSLNNNRLTISIDYLKHRTLIIALLITEGNDDMAAALDLTYPAILSAIKTEFVTGRTESHAFLV